MSNIFHKKKHGFLILGFTGPLSSGCTSAAEFFEKEINNYISKRCEKALPRIQDKITRSRNDIKKQKNLLNKPKANKHQIYTAINRLHYKLKEQLNLRETLTVLTEYNYNNFMYISLTDMLVKLTIESLSEKRETELEGPILKLKSLINFDPIKFSDVRLGNCMWFLSASKDVSVAAVQNLRSISNTKSCIW